MNSKIISDVQAVRVLWGWAEAPSVHAGGRAVHGASIRVVWPGWVHYCDHFLFCLRTPLASTSAWARRWRGWGRPRPYSSQLSRGRGAGGKTGNMRKIQLHFFVSTFDGALMRNKNNFNVFRETCLCLLLVKLNSFIIKSIFFFRRESAIAAASQQQQQQHGRGGGRHSVSGGGFTLEALAAGGAGGGFAGGGGGGGTATTASSSSVSVVSDTARNMKWEKADRSCCGQNPCIIFARFMLQLNIKEMCE